MSAVVNAGDSDALVQHSSRMAVVSSDSSYATVKAQWSAPLIRQFLNFAYEMPVYGTTLSSASPISFHCSPPWAFSRLNGANLTSLGDHVLH